LITYDEWLDQLAEYILGWIGLSQEALESSDLNALVIARTGREKMLQAIFGRQDDEDTSPVTAAGRPVKPIPRTTLGPDGKPLQLTPEAFDSMFG